MTTTMTMTPAALIASLVALGASLEVSSNTGRCPATDEVGVWHCHTLTLDHLEISIWSVEAGTSARWTTSMESIFVFNDAAGTHFYANAAAVLAGFAQAARNLQLVALRAA